MLEQIYRFLGISGIGWILDFTTFTVLGLIINNLFIVSTVSALVGASFVFFLSPRFIFNDKNTLPLRLKYVLYISYQIILILFISFLIVEVEYFLKNYVVEYLPLINGFSYILSKILITPIAMTCNFLVMKFIIEKI